MNLLVAVWMKISFSNIIVNDKTEDHQDSLRTNLVLISVNILRWSKSATSLKPFFRI